MCGGAHWGAAGDRLDSWALERGVEVHVGARWLGALAVPLPVHVQSKDRLELAGVVASVGDWSGHRDWGAGVKGWGEWEPEVVGL